MYIIFVLNHPAHFHLFKNTIKILLKQGHQIEVFVRPKDVLLSLLESDGISYNLFSDCMNKRKYVLLSSITGLIKKDIILAKHVKKKKPDMLIGTDWSITHVGSVFNIPSIVLNEDDTAATPENKFFYPFAKTLLLPDCCDIDKWAQKRVSYAGYHELAYLHPNFFEYDKRIVRNCLGGDAPYIIVRLVKLTASHDKGKKGLDYEILENIQA